MSTVFIFDEGDQYLKDHFVTFGESSSWETIGGLIGIKVPMILLTATVTDTEKLLL